MAKSKFIKIAVCCLILLCVLWYQYSHSFHYVQQDVAELKPLAQALHIGITRPTASFSVPVTDGAIQGVVLTSDPARFNYIVYEELSLYSAKMLKKARVKHVLICGWLKLSGQLRSAIPDFEHHTLFLDAERVTDEPYKRHGVHHEIFHMIDWFDDGVLYDDPEWKKLNPPEFTYGHGGISMQNDPTSGLAEGAPAGFLNRYSASGVEEDKAEIFSQLMLDSSVFKTRYANDAVLQKKVAMMKALCETFCPEFNAKFWETVDQKVRH